MYLKRRRIHCRVLKLDPGEELRHAKESISFSAESYITDPPFPPDRMTYVIYHMGPSQTRGGEGKPGPCDAASSSSSSHCTQYGWLAERALLIWREGGERRLRGEGRRACFVWMAGRVAGRARDWQRHGRGYVLSHCLLSHAAQPLTLFSLPPPPHIPFLCFSFFYFSPFSSQGKKKKRRRRTSRGDRYHSASLASEGWYK